MAVTSSPIQNTIALRDRVIAILHTARALSATGRAVDLTGLDNLIGMLCAKILDLPDEEARGFRAALCGIAAELETLNQALIETA